jgi:hypothetical protein
VIRARRRTNWGMLGYASRGDRRFWGSLRSPLSQILVKITASEDFRKLLWKLPLLPRHPLLPGRRSAGLWKAATPNLPPGTLPQTLENRFAVSHSPPASTAAGETL